MKIHHRSLLLIIFLVLICGCREITVTTKINKDGSFTRFVSVKGNPSDIEDAGLPYPVDDSWSKTVTSDTTDSTKMIIVYSKYFKNSKTLNQEIAADTSWCKNLKRTIEIKKGFGFFFSYITFRETYSPPNIFNRLNYKDFLTQEDILFFSGEKIPITRDDSVKFEKASDRVDNFIAEEFATEIIAILQDGITRVNDSSLKTEQVVPFKDTIIASVGDYLFKSKSYIELYKNLTGNPAVEKLNNLQPPIFEEFNHKASLFLSLLLMEDFEQSVEMPGIITSTNSTRVSGNKVSWGISSSRFQFEDYEMMVESRVVNTWAFVVTGIILLAVLLFMMIKVGK